MRSVPHQRELGTEKGTSMQENANKDVDEIIAEAAADRQDAETGVAPNAPREDAAAASANAPAGQDAAHDSDGPDAPDSATETGADGDAMDAAADASPENADAADATDSETADAEGLDREIWGLLTRVQHLGGRALGSQHDPRGTVGRDIGRGQGRVLALLRLRPEITQRDLNTILDMRQQSLAELIGKLERRGYVTRRRSEQDKRVMVVSLTEEGRAAADALADPERRFAFLDCLDVAEKRSLAALLARIVERLENDLGARADGGNEFEERRERMAEMLDTDRHPHGHRGGRGPRDARFRDGMDPRLAGGIDPRLAAMRDAGHAMHDTMRERAREGREASRAEKRDMRDTMRDRERDMRDASHAMRDEYRDRARKTRDEFRGEAHPSRRTDRTR